MVQVFTLEDGVSCGTKGAGLIPKEDSEAGGEGRKEGEATEGEEMVDATGRAATAEAEAEEGFGETL
jgi:hypothetical protein